MLSQNNYTVLEMLNETLKTLPDLVDDLEELLKITNQLLNKLTPFNTNELPGEEKLLVQGVYDKFKNLINVLEQKKCAVQSQMMNMNHKKSTFKAYMQYDTNAKFINKDI